MHEPEQNKPLSPSERVAAFEAILDGQPQAVAIIEDPIAEVMVLIRRMDGDRGDYDMQCIGQEASGSARIDSIGTLKNHDPLYLATKSVKNADDLIRQLGSARRLSDTDAIAALELFDTIDSTFRADGELIVAHFEEKMRNLVKPEFLSLESHHRAELNELIADQVLDVANTEEATYDGQHISIQFRISTQKNAINVFLITPEERDIGDGPLDNLYIIFRHEELDIVLENTTTGEIIDPAQADSMITFIGIHHDASYRPIIRD